jgi:SAM-dependent methyltransferase
MNRQKHWDTAYNSKSPDEVSWYQPLPEKSLELIQATGVRANEPILDVGGGASKLVDELLNEGFENVSVLDVSPIALQHARERLGVRAERVRWIELDILSFDAPHAYAIWHDRAVFHFLTSTDERDRYIDIMHTSLQPGGHFALATFGPEGPTRCSNLDVQRYSIAALETLLLGRFKLRSHEIDVHSTPSGSEQQFIYSWWQKT